MIEQRELGAAPFVEWSDFLAGLEWRQDEHVSIIGPTGQGKTTLALELLARRSFVVIMATKPEDPTLRRLIKSGEFDLIREWPPPRPVELQPRVILWPKWKNDSDTEKQRVAIAHGIDGVIEERNWCVYIDELYWVADLLRLPRRLRTLWTQGRALGVSVVGCTQRPAWVPKEMFSQATHLFFFRSNDPDDLKKMSGLGTADPNVVRQRIKRLGEHEVLYINTRTDEMLVTKVERG